MIEYQIIGTFLIDESTRIFIDKLEEHDFPNNDSKTVFVAIKDLYKDKKDITYFTVADTAGVKLTRIAEITGSVATTATIEQDIRYLKSQSNKRKMTAILQELLQDINNTKADAIEVKNTALVKLREIESYEDDDVVTLDEAMTETLNKLEERYNRRDEKMHYGLAKLDMVMAGLHPEELTTIGARPGVGKTILGMQIAMNVARSGKRVLFVSLEMSVTQLCERMIASYSDIENSKLRTGNMNDNDWREVTTAMARLQYNNFMLDKTSRTVQHIRSKIIKHKPDIVIIDYLQLLHPAQKEHSREREVAVMTRDLKMMTIDFSIPIIILSQLNRDADGNRPRMSDLRESGAIEQDSDNILFIHEPNDTEVSRYISTGVYSAAMFEEFAESNKKLAQLIIEKQRNGATGIINAVKIPRLMKFLELER